MWCLALVLLWVQVLLKLDTELLAEWCKLLKVLLVLALVLDLCLNSCYAELAPSSYTSYLSLSPGVSEAYNPTFGMPLRRPPKMACDLPSNTLTAVGKSLTRRAALSAATMTDGAGTRS